LESLKGRDSLENLRVDVRIILKLIFGSRFEGCVLELSGSGYELLMGCCEHSVETSVSVKGGELFY
jgi:hypothetical protein